MSARERRRGRRRIPIPADRNTILANIGRINARPTSFTLHWSSSQRRTIRLITNEMLQNNQTARPAVRAHADLVLPRVDLVFHGNEFDAEEYSSAKLADQLYDRIYYLRKPRKPHRVQFDEYASMTPPVPMLMPMQMPIPMPISSLQPNQPAFLNMEDSGSWVSPEMQLQLQQADMAFAGQGDASMSLVEGIDVTNRDSDGNSSIDSVSVDGDTPAVDGWSAGPIWQQQQSSEPPMPSAPQLGMWTSDITSSSSHDSHSNSSNNSPSVATNNTPLTPLSPDEQWPTAWQQQQLPLVPQAFAVDSAMHFEAVSDVTSCDSDDGNDNTLSVSVPFIPTVPHKERYLAPPASQELPLTHVQNTNSQYLNSNLDPGLASQFQALQVGVISPPVPSVSSKAWDVNINTAVNSHGVGGMMGGWASRDDRGMSTSAKGKGRVQLEHGDEWYLKDEFWGFK